MDEVDGEDPAEEAYPHRYLDTLREISDAGMHLAVPAALFYCAKHNVPVPAWLTERASRLLNGLLHLHDDRTRKRMREMIKAYRKGQIHFARYGAVSEAQEARDALLIDVKKLESMPGTKAKLRIKDLTSALDEIGTSDEAIFEAVSSQLKGTVAAAGADTIKKSYQELLREKRQRKMMFKYHVFDEFFLQRIGALQSFKKVKGSARSINVS